MKLLYTGALFDSSGYAEASRNYVKALLTVPEIELSLQSVSFEDWKTNVDSFYQIAEPYLNKDIGKPDIHIVHLTPENFPRFRRTDVKTIGMTVWETDRLPNSWIPLCNMMDEIWVPCDWNIEVFKSSGITVPVKKIAHCVDLKEFDSFVPNENIGSQLNKHRFNFYSIFQWSSRKNPEGLLRAYLSEFNTEDLVCLTLKTYYMNNTLQDKQMVIDAIKNIKEDLQLQQTPPVLLIHGSLSRDEILTIHSSCDCFVLPHRSEGWGVPHFEALAMGKPTIATAYGGNLEFMNQENSWLIPNFLTPVAGMRRPTYNGKMHWAEPDLNSLQKSMRQVFSDEELRKNKILNGKNTVRKFSIENIGQKIYQMTGEL